MSHIRAPFTTEQQRALNAWQARGDVHSFTCRDDGADLVAAADGWHCPACEYTQQWAHDFMADQVPRDERGER